MRPCRLLLVLAWWVASAAPAALAAEDAQALAAPAATAPEKPATPPAEKPPAPPEKAAETPAVPPPPPAPPAKPTAPLPGKGKADDDVIISSLPDVDGVYGGKVTFAKEAFPILDDRRAADVQGLLRTARFTLCRDCRSGGKVGKKQTYQPRAASFTTPVVKQWDETCEKCGGYGNTYDAKFPSRLLMLVERLSHVNRDEKFTDLRKLAEERLAAVFEVRDKTYDTFRCQEVKGWYSRWVTGIGGHRYEDREYGVVGIDVVKAQTKTFHLDVGELVRPLWLDARSRAPAGQAVLVVGEASDKAEAGGWVWIRMLADADAPHPTRPPTRRGGRAPGGATLVEPPRSAPPVLLPEFSGPVSAIILCGTPTASTAPIGRAAIGGLLVGTWRPSDAGADAGAAAGTDAPGADAPAPAAGADPAGPAPAEGSPVPVILAVLSATGK